MTLAERLRQSLTGDIAFALRDLAERDAMRHPASVCRYARLSALEEIAGYFDSDQGIPTAEAQELDQALRLPLSQLVEGDALRDCTDADAGPLSDVVLVLANLRAS